MLEWLDKFDWRKDAVNDPWLGKGIDATFATLAGAYAFFPMIAFQSTSVSDNRRVGSRPRRIRRPWHVLSKTRLREFLTATLMRPNELIVAGIALARALSRRPSR